MILPAKKWRIKDGEQLTVGARPDVLHAAEPCIPVKGEARFTLPVDASEHLGGESFHHCKTPHGGTVVVEANGNHDQDLTHLPLRLHPEDAHVFGEDGLSRAV